MFPDMLHLMSSLSSAGTYLKLQPPETVGFSIETNLGMEQILGQSLPSMKVTPFNPTPIYKLLFVLSTKQSIYVNRVFQLK